MQSKLSNPPGPGSWKLLSSLRNLRDQPHEYLLSAFQEYGDVVHFDIPGRQAFFINHPDTVQHVLQMNHRNYDKNTFQYNVLSRITGKGLLTNEGGEDWLQKRRIAQPAFSKNSLEGLVPIVVDAVESMLMGWEEANQRGGLIDVDREMMQCTLDVVAKMLFGADLSNQTYRLTGAVMDALNYLIFQTRTLMMIPGWFPIRENRVFREAMTTIEQAVNELIDRRSNSTPGHDLLGRLLAAQDESGQPVLSRQEVRDEVVTMLIAGHETVASSLTWAWYLLARHPEVRVSLQEEVVNMLGNREPVYADVSNLVYTQQAYHEALRLFPPAWLITRRAKDADVVGGYPITAGGLVIISPFTMHRRPDIWPEPDQFIPDRFSEDSHRERHRFGFIPFGGGPRLCIGNRFAEVEATLILAMVARRFSLKLPPDTRVAVEALVTMRPANGMPMKIEAIS